MPELAFADVDDLQGALARHAYLADRGLTTAIYLALSLGKPLLLEGEAGVGKTEVAKVLATLLDRELIRLQCYDGIDASQALYEWNYSRQLIAVRAMDAAEADTHVEDLFGPEFLVERPLLAAIRAGDRAVLLVDELDRADDEFEAFLLEILSEFAVTIPEIGRVGALTPPAVIVTSNRTRELHDALKRRCLYHWIDHPDLDREVDIVRARAPHVGAALARDVARAVARLRELDLAKRPGVAETIDWANALAFLGAEQLDTRLARDTLGSVVKDHEDQELVMARLGARRRGARATRRLRPGPPSAGAPGRHRPDRDLPPRGRLAGARRPRLALLGRAHLARREPRRPRRLRPRVRRVVPLVGAVGIGAHDRAHPSDRAPGVRRRTRRAPGRGRTHRRLVALSGR